MFPKGVSQRRYQLACIKVTAYSGAAAAGWLAGALCAPKCAGLMLPVAETRACCRCASVAALLCGVCRCQSLCQCQRCCCGFRHKVAASLLQTALLTNALVCLPTGLGKTLIAAVVMHNFARWFPEVWLIT